MNNKTNNYDATIVDSNCYVKDVLKSFFKYSRGNSHLL